MFLKSFQHDVGSSFAQLRVITSGIPSCSTYTGCFCCSYRTPLSSYLQTIQQLVARLPRESDGSRSRDICTMIKIMTYAATTMLSISAIITPHARSISASRCEIATLISPLRFDKFPLTIHVYFLRKYQPEATVTF